MSRKPKAATRHLALALLGVFAISVPLLTTFASLVTTDLFIVTVDEPINEDVYVTSMSAKVEGVIDGDLTIFTGDLTISGRVTGSVTVFSSGSVVVESTGQIDGSLRGAAVNVSIRGEVGDDLFMTAASVVVQQGGTVGRDALAFGGTGRIEGSVGRDVRGRTLRLVVDGAVGGDLDIATQRLEFGSTASVGGDALYRSPLEVSVPEGTSIGGTVTRLPTQSNFVYGVILALVNVVGFLGFLLAGLVLLWALRGSSARAVGAVLKQPIRSLLVGMLTVVVLPVAIGILAVTLVGLPLAGLLMLVAVGLFIVGPIPAITALGNRVLLRRGGLFGAFIFGAVLWRLGIWLIPIVGGVIYLIGLVWGVGAWVLGVRATRRMDPVPVELLPVSLTAAPQIPPEWEPPLAPGFTAQTSHGDVVGTTDDMPSDAPAIELGSSAEADAAIAAADQSSMDQGNGSDSSGPEHVGDDDEPPPSFDGWGLPSS